MTTTPHNDDNLMIGFIVSMIAPLLMAGGLTDISLATAAARQAIDAYRTRGEPELLSAAQIVGFSVTSLDSLRLSAGPAASVNQKLRLRGNANGLSRSCQRANAMLAQQRGDPAYDPPANTEPDPNEALRQAELLDALAETTGLIARAAANVEAEKAQEEAAAPGSANTAAPETPGTAAAPGSANTAAPEIPGTAAAPGSATAAAPEIPGTAAAPLPPHEISAKPAAARVEDLESPASAQHPQPAPGKPAPQSIPASNSTTRGPDPGPATPAATAAPQARPRTEADNRLCWAAAMNHVAREFADGLPGLPQPERRIEMLRIQALNSVARKLTRDSRRRPIAPA